MRRTTILHNYFFMNEGGLLLADMLLLGRYCPVYTVKTMPRRYISRNEMSSDYVNVSFFKWKGFHGTFIEHAQDNSLHAHVAVNIINETNVSE